MSSPAEVVHNYLIAQGLTFRPPATDLTKWYSYVAFLPTDPDQIVVLFDAGGDLDGRLMADGTQIIHPNVQVRLRSKDYKTGWNKGEAIADLLQQAKMIKVTIGALTYLIHAARMSMPLMPIGQEEKSERWEFTINYRLTLSEV